MCIVQCAYAPKKLLVKKLLFKIILGPKNFKSNKNGNFWSKKNLVKNLFSKINFGKKNFWSKNIWSKTFGPKKVLVKRKILV